MITLGEVAATVLTEVAPLPSAKSGQLSFLTNPRHRRFLTITRAAAVILSPEDAEGCPPAVVAANPHVANPSPSPGVYSSGLTVEPNRLWNKISARLRRLDEMFRRLAALEKKIGRDGAT